MTTPKDILFELDHMVIKLGKYLRVLGYDAAWNIRLRTHELILKANREGRWFLTRNLQLSDRYPPAHRAMILRPEDPLEQLRAVCARFELDLQSGLFTKCIRCNIVLEDVPDKEQVRSRVHPHVLEQHDRFTRCPHCGTVFWPGSHVRNTCRKLGLSLPGECRTSNADR